MSEAEHWGLMALGVSGSWQVDLNERLTGEDAWQLTVNGPLLYLGINIAKPSIVAEILGFFEATAGMCEYSEFAAGMCLGQPLIVAKDEEFADRYFVYMSGAETTCRFTLFGADLAHLRDALRQVLADIPSV